MLGRVKLDDALLTCDKGNFNQITAWSRNRTRVTAVRDACATIVPPAPPPPTRQDRDKFAGCCLCLVLLII